jgi:ATP-binding cassette subfamily B multidrug efflux pump
MNSSLSSPIQNEQDTQRPVYSFKTLWFSFFKEHPWILILGILSVAGCNLFQVLGPRFLGYGVDFLRGNSIPEWLKQSSFVDTFTTIFLCFVFTHFMLMILRVAWRFTLARSTHIAGSWLRGKVWTHARLFPQDKLDREYTTGVLMNASTSDVNTGRFAFGFTIVGTIDVIFLTSLAVIMMLTINVKMTLIMLMMTPILPYFIKKLAAKEMDLFSHAQDFLGQFNDQCSQAVATIKLQRLTNTGTFWEKKLVQSASEYRAKRMQAIKVGLQFFPLMGLGDLFSLSVLLIVGISFTLSGSLTVGEFVTMQSYVFLIQDPLMELGVIVSEWQKGRTSINRLSKIYNEKPDEAIVKLGKQVDENEMVYSVKNLDFSFPEENQLEKSQRKIIHQVSFNIKKGERLGIFGVIGSGKTTMINLLSGLEQRYNGTLLFYGKPLKDYEHLALRRHMALVPQRTFLFADTIKNNVKMASNLSDDEVWHFLEIAGLADDVKSFPYQLETQLGEWGINLSGGQKQRLTLARALATKPQVLLLDDCLSAVDTVTEEKILKNLDQHLKNVTLIWVAHRASTLKYCDQIIEFKV